MIYWIITYLADNADENFWKLLKYNDVDALSEPALSRDEKLNMLSINGDIKTHNIFLTPMIPDLELDSRTVLKIYNWDIQKGTATSVAIRWAFDVMVGNYCTVVYNAAGEPAARSDLLIYYLIQAIDGREIGGLGKLKMMTSKGGYYGNSFIAESRTYVGYRLLLNTLVDMTGYCCD